jgi:hypothetical protein
MAPEQRAERLIEGFALDVPQRHVDGRQGQRKDAARPGAAGGAPQFGGDSLDVQRVVADH